jgi:hypothetical protein
LQLQVHVFEASGIFLAEYRRIDRRLPVHHLVISLESCAFAEVIVGWEHDDIGYGRQSLLLILADAADMNRVR